MVGAGNDDIYRFERSQTDESVLATISRKKRYQQNKKLCVTRCSLAVKVVQAIHENAEDPNSKIIEKKPLPMHTCSLKGEIYTHSNAKANAKGNAVQEIKYDLQNYFVLSYFSGITQCEQDLLLQ